MAHTNLSMHRPVSSFVGHSAAGCPIMAAPPRRCLAPAAMPQPGYWQQRRSVISAGASGDGGFDDRLAKLKKKGGGEKKQEKQETPKEALAAAKKGQGRPEYDYSEEKEYFVSAPHRGDLGLNLVLGATLLWLPLTIASVARGAFVKYRFTNLRLSVTTKAGPLRDEQLDAAYQEITNITTVGRGFGAWGDMVVTLKGGDKIELRALPRYKEMEEYMLKRRDELRGSGSSNMKQSSAEGTPAKASSKGF